MSEAMNLQDEKDSIRADMLKINRKMTVADAAYRLQVYREFACSLL